MLQSIDGYMKMVWVCVEYEVSPPCSPHINKPIDMDKHGDGQQSTLVTIIQAPSFVKLLRLLSPQVSLSFCSYG